MSRRDLNQAKAVLEAWAYWKLNTDGFPKRSSIARIGEIRGEANGSRLPDGIEQDRLAQDATFVFLSMRRDPNNKISLKRKDILQQFYLERKEGETVRGLCKRLGKFDHNEYSAAINEFAHKLDMYYLIQDIVNLEQEMSNKNYIS